MEARPCARRAYAGRWNAATAPKLRPAVGNASRDDLRPATVERGVLNWNPARRLPLNEVHVWRIRIRVIPILASLTNLERLPITAAQETRIRRVPGRAHGPPPVPGAVEEVLRSQDRLKPEHVAAICQRAA